MRFADFEYERWCLSFLVKKKETHLEVANVGNFKNYFIGQKLE